MARLPTPLPPASAAEDATIVPDALRWSGAVRCHRDDAPPLDVTGVDVGERVRVAPVDRGPSPLIDVVEASPHRIEPRCTQLPDCPGCPLRVLRLPRRRNLTDALHRRAFGPQFETVPWVRLPGASDDGGRARAVARALRDVQGNLVLGMVRRGHRPIALGRCPLQNVASRSLIAQLQRELRALSVEPWDPELRRGTLRHVVVQAIGDSARVILAVDGRGPPIDCGRLLLERSAVPILVDALPRRGAGIVHRPRAVRGEPWLHFEIDGDRFRAGPRAWVPQAPTTVAAVRRHVLDALAPTATDRIIELGCGVGVLSLPLARRAAELIGVDIERDAILDAEVNAVANGVTHARFRTGEAGHALRRLLAEGVGADRVVMHAMRRPFGPRAMAAIRALDPARIVCLSPFAPALARDLALLPGHRPVSVALCDQTPGTVPDLTIVTLERRGA